VPHEHEPLPQQQKQSFHQQKQKYSRSTRALMASLADVSERCQCGGGAMMV